MSLRPKVPQVNVSPIEPRLAHVACVLRLRKLRLLVHATPVPRQVVLVFEFGAAFTNEHAALVHFRLHRVKAVIQITADVCQASVGVGTVLFWAGGRTSTNGR